MITQGQKKYDLTQSPLYMVRSKKKLCSTLNLSSPAELINLLKLENPYRKFEVQSKNKMRPVQVPSHQLIPVHNRIFNLFKRIQLPDYLHSGIKGRSYVSNAKAHRGTKKTFTTDIAKFYPSVTRAMVAGFFRETMKCSLDVAAILADVTTCDGRIPTGSALSQLLAYLSCKDMFDELHTVCTNLGGIMTCYVDDLTFSGDFVTRSWAYNTIKPIIKKHGFFSHKDKFFGEGQPKEITGVIVSGNQIRVCNRHHKAIYNLILKLSETTDPESSKKMYNSLLGKISCAGQIEEKFNRKRKQIQNKRKIIISA